MGSDSTDDLPMTSMSTVTEQRSSKSTALSTRTIIAITLTISAGLAIGLGVGLGVGLQNTEYIYVPVTEGPKDQTTTKPAIPATTNGVIPAATTTVNAPDATTPISPDATTPKVTDEPTPTFPIPNDAPWTNYRLRESMVPTHYGLTLRPNLTENYYTGSVEITFSTSEVTDYVIIHAHETLMISRESVRVQRVSTLAVVNVIQTFRWPEYQFYVIQLESELITDENYTLAMDFSNSLIGSLVGIYKSTYVDPESGETKGIMASDFEATDARKGFPCFDEPALKAEYSTTIIHESIHTALSNMPVESKRDLGNGMTETTYYRSVPMSTYLSAFIVGELDYVEAFSGRNITLRIYGAPYLIKERQAELAINATAAMFDNYEILFNTNYSLPKYDQVALPEYSAGATEYWGLVAFRETNLMWDPMESSTSRKQGVTAVVAHEMVHQWFGNIVTMKWWNNIWLNEGFASYFEYRGVAWANPDWLMDNHHVIDDIQSALRADQSVGSRPIVSDVNTPAEITSIFDTISYQKGSSVLNMLNTMLGEDLFIGGIRTYLKNRHFGVATEQDLWSDMQEYMDSQGAPYDIKTLMDPWVLQMGYPVVTVTTSGNEVTAVQEPGFTDPELNITALPASDFNYEWYINLNYFTQSEPDRIENGWLNISATDIKFDVSSGFGDWLKFNVREQMFHRVNYDNAMWAAIANQLSSDLTAISEIDRSHLLDDAFNLAPAKRIDYTQALDLTKYLDQEESYFVWDAFASGSAYIRAMLMSTPDYTNFQAYYVTRVKPIADKLGWDPTIGTHEDKRNRPLVLDLAARYGDEDTLNNATGLFQDWRANKYIHPDLRSLVYRYGIQGGTQDDWNYMLERYKNSTVAGERDSLLRGLSSTDDVELIDTLLELTRDPLVIKEQDFFSCLTYIAAYTTIGNTMTWSWVRVNWNYLVNRFGLDNRSLGRLVPSIVDDYNTELKKWEVESFFEANPEAGAGESRRLSALLQIDLNIAWMADNAIPIGQWLETEVAGL